jgi:hypothetical protein
MPKYDAFGREIGEDTLSQWRSEESRDDAGEAIPVERPEPEREKPEAPGPEPEPVVMVSASEPETPAPERTVRVEMPRPSGRRRRRPRTISRLIIVLIVIGVGVNLIVNAGREIGDAIDGSIPDVIEGAAPDAIDPAVPDVQAEPDAPPPAGLQPGSLIRPAALREALRRLRAENVGRPHTLRLDPTRLDATMIEGNRLSAVQLSHTGDLRTVTSASGGGHLEPMGWRLIDPAAPSRLARAAAAKLRRPVTGVNYLVATLQGGEVMWGVYFKNGAIFLGDPHGRLNRRVS